MDFTPTAEKLIPDLSPREELVVLARALWREGYNDHLAGHITVNLGDGTLLCNPWLLTWAELRPEQVLRIDLEGRVRRGRLAGAARASRCTWSCTSCAPTWSGRLHNHPLYGTVWADMGEIPPILDQSSALGGGELALVNEYAGPVNDPASARRAIEQMGTASAALLAGHGVFVLGGSARAVHQRAVALEQRCQRGLVRPGGREPAPTRSCPTGIPRRHGGQRRRGLHRLLGGGRAGRAAGRPRACSHSRRGPRGGAGVLRRREDPGLRPAAAHRSP